MPRPDTQHNLANIEVVVLDLGGVIVDIDFGLAFAAWAVASGTEAARLAERFQFDETYCQHERGEISATTYFQTLSTTLGIDLSDEAWEAGWNAIFIGTFPGVEALLLDVAKHLPLYCFSNTNVTHHREWSQRFPAILEPFHGLFLSHEMGLRKPDLAAFHHIAAQIGTAPRRILFFDDLADNVVGAKAAGMSGQVVSRRADLDVPLRALLDLKSTTS